MQIPSNAMKAILIILGIALIADSLTISKNLPADCKSDDLRNANRGILVIGTGFMTAGISWFAFGGCGESTGWGVDVFVGFFGVLGIVLTTLAGVVNSNATNDDPDSPCEFEPLPADSTDDEPPKVGATFTMVVGIISIVCCSAYVGLKVYNANQGKLAFSM